MKFEVFFDEEAEDDLDSLYQMIASSAGERVASRFVGGVRDLCLSLSDFPRRDRPRDDLAPGVRTLVFGKRAVVSHEVAGTAVYIVHVFYAGRDCGREDFTE